MDHEHRAVRDDRSADFSGCEFAGGGRDDIAVGRGGRRRLHRGEGGERLGLHTQRLGRVVKRLPALARLGELDADFLRARTHRRVGLFLDQFIFQLLARLFERLLLGCLDFLERENVGAVPK